MDGTRVRRLAVIGAVVIASIVPFLVRRRQEESGPHTAAAETPVPTSDGTTETDGSKKQKRFWTAPIIYFLVLAFLALGGSAFYFWSHVRWPSLGAAPLGTSISLAHQLGEDMWETTWKTVDGKQVRALRLKLAPDQLAQSLTLLDGYASTLVAEGNDSLPATTKQMLTDVLNGLRDALATTADAEGTTMTADAEGTPSTTGTTSETITTTTTNPITIRYDSAVVAQNARAVTAYASSIYSLLRPQQGFFWNEDPFRYLEAIFWALAGIVVSFFIHLKEYREWKRIEVAEHFGILLAFPAIAFAVVVLITQGTSITGGTAEVDLSNPYLLAAVSFVIGLQANKAIKLLTKSGPLQNGDG